MAQDAAFVLQLSPRPMAYIQTRDVWVRDALYLLGAP